MGIVTVLEAFVGKLIGKEIEAWLPQAGPRLMRFAVSRLPVAEKARYAEEWAADLDAIPGDLSKFIYAVGFMRAAWRMGSITSELEKLDRTETQIFLNLGTSDVEALHNFLQEKLKLLDNLPHDMSTRVAYLRELLREVQNFGDGVDIEFTANGIRMIPIKIKQFLINKGAEFDEDSAS